MQITTKLSEKQTQDLKELLEDCEEKTKQHIDFFVEQEWNEIPECPCFFLTYENEQLVCAVSVFLAGQEAELSAVTRYEKRRKGFFRNAIKQAKKVLNEYQIKKVFFRIDSENEVARQVLEHWNAKKQKTECLMVLLEEQEKRINQILDKKKKQLFIWQQPDEKEKIEKEIKNAIKRLAIIHASAFDCGKKDSQRFLQESFLEGAQLWEYCEQEKTIGVCMITESVNSYFLSALGILKEEQGKGKSFHFLTEVIDRIWKKEKKSIILQVELENIPAVKLYQKIGFFIQQQMTEYVVFLDKIYYNEKKFRTGEKNVFSRR